MLAARWHGPKDIRVEDITEPKPGPGELLVAVELCGLCGTDFEEYQHGPVSVPVSEPNPLTGRTAPIVLGHEIVGTVAAHGTDGRGPAIGTRVIPDVVLGCGTCWWCRRHQEGICPRGAVIGQHTDGGLAEYMVCPADTCVVVPESVQPEVAVFAEPTAVAVRAVRKAGDLAGATVAVIGAGTVGMLVGQVARAAGAARLIMVDPASDRCELALRLGADAATAPAGAADVVMRRTGGMGADATFECSGAAGALTAALRLARAGGTVVAVGFRDGDEQVPLLTLVLGERRIAGSAAHLWDEDVAAAVRLLTDAVADPRQLPVTRVPLPRVAADGFAAPPSGRKVLIDPRPAQAARGGTVDAESARR